MRYLPIIIVIGLAVIGIGAIDQPQDHTLSDPCRFQTVEPMRGRCEPYLTTRSEQ